MSSRSVGGASGAGCAIFSFASLLIAIGLAAWLSSQIATDTTGGGNDVETAEDLIDQIPDLADLGIPGAVPEGQTLSVAANGPLDDGGAVTVSGNGFAVGSVELTMCLAGQTRSAGGMAGCDSATTVVADVNALGELAATYPVKRVITVLETPYDCAAFAEACVVVAHPPGSPDLGHPGGITFAEGLPAVEAETPHGG